jgi:flagellar basal-body rod protein FlgG
MMNTMQCSASAMNALAKKHDVIANNLANVNTDGYKSDLALFRSFKSTLDERMGLVGTGVGVDAVTNRFEQGAIAFTDNPLNAAISGNAMFAVMTPQGEKYTRNGNFSRNAVGELVTAEGYPVMGDGGPITIDGGEVSIMNDGTVTVSGETAGKLRLVGVRSGDDLEKQGANLYTFKKGRTPAAVGDDVGVLGKHLEKSDVNTVREMVQMIEMQRAFDMNQKCIMAADDILRQGLSLGRAA